MPVAEPQPTAPERFSLGMEVIELEDAIMAASTPQAPVAAAAPPAPAPAARAAPVAPPAAAAPPARAVPATPPIATLEVINEGPMKGRKFEIFSALTNVGRGPHNDIIISDESLSGSHAKILKRDGAWWVVDQGSTNGTYVGGRRVQGEQQLTGAPDVRFGGMKLIFRPAAASLEDTGGGTRAIAAIHVDAAKKAAPRSSAVAPKPEPAAVPAEKKKGCAAMIAFLFALAAVGAGTIALLLFSVRG
jgi:pSer/pThr/pTyr-binding forkhead associated (FHA) protein